MRIILLALVLVSAAFAARSAAKPDQPPRAVGSLAESGQRVAQLRCASCHAIDMTSQSPRMSAPPFRELRVRFNPLTWERAMARLATERHDEMPPLTLSDADVRDLKAFIDSLR